MTKHLRLGIIGAGNFARRFHFPALRYLKNNPPKGIALDHLEVCDLDHEKALGAVHDFGINKACETIEEIIENPQLDGFVVIVNEEAALPVIQKLLPRQLPIFSEKPPGKNVAEANLLAEQVRVPNLVAFNRRFDSLSTRFRIEVEKMEEPYFVDCQFYRYNRTEDHFITRTGIHAINFMEYVFGEIADVRTTVLSNEGNQARSYLCDLQFASGLHGRIRFLPETGTLIERFEVHSAQRSIHFHLGHYDSPDYPGLMEIWEAGEKIESLVGQPDPYRIHSTGSISQHVEFLEAIAFGKPIRSTFQNSVNSMRIAERIERETV